MIELVLRTTECSGLVRKQIYQVVWVKTCKK